MASLTPGVLSNLLELAAGKVISSSSSPLLSSHRFPLLQVIEIVPCLSDNQWRSERFFVKVSDSLHAAYVAVSAADDADLIRSDEIQLGQFVYIRGGLHVEKGCPVPVVRGLKPVPKRRTCVGNPSDLVSSDLLLDFTPVSVDSIKKKRNLGDTRRLSLDSARRSCWDHTSPPVTRRRDAALLLSSSPRLKPKLVLSDKNLPKNESPSKHLNCETPTLRNRNVVKPASPISIAKSPKDGIKPLSKAVTPPVAYHKLPSSHRTWSDQRISWTGLPKTIQSLGKEVSSHRLVAVKAAVKALEEASAMESVLLSLQSFAELCDSSKRLSAGQVVRRFLDIYHSTQNTGKAVHMLLTHNGSCRSAAKKNAAAWVQDAVVTGFSQFNLFKEPGIQEDAASSQDHHHYIIIQSSSEKLSSKENTTSPRNQAYKGVKLPSRKHRSDSERCSLEGKNRLKESLSLAEELLRVSSQWFFKYLENSLKKGTFFVKKEEATGKESLLVSLKAVNCWLDDLIRNRCEASEKVEELRKKLQRFLLKHMESAIGKTM
ncbi:hypothetical protein Bca4012_029836 [Brassica carinata]|uniref:DUF936 domain-containing protein n=4 Tax=Brassica TaxID=3705 RepID=A0A0D3BSX3_BRAOL|nr:PREDICTED: uncharacterized protein LOC106340641 [Brassica oleracea var. oleracea]KAG2289163.1 hypothetical protein Bca52824_048767 [Brassica carinata]CAF1824220.1 unnamed protein product [Brassica napus]CDY60513.1 BnaC04g54240D [Brassica napus]VDD07089.1 unnamed protein product [Brassica oleracea]